MNMNDNIIEMEKELIKVDNEFKELLEDLMMEQQEQM